VTQEATGIAAHRLAIASLAFGLIAALGGIRVPPIIVFFAIPAIVCGHMALTWLTTTNLRSDRRMAMAGLVFGYLAVVELVYIVLLLPSLIVGALTHGAQWIHHLF
jgi:uncharacterized protein DUF4190